MYGSDGSDDLCVNKCEWETVLPRVHVVVDERIDHRVTHRQPVEGEEDVLDVFVGDDLVVNKLVNEISVIW